MGRKKDERSLEDIVIAIYEDIFKRKSLKTIQLVLFSYIGLLVCGFLLIMAMLGGTNGGVVICFVYTSCLSGLLFAFYLAGYILSENTGTPEMMDLAAGIREGAEGFLKVQYGAIFKMAFVVGGCLFFLFLFRQTLPELASVSPIYIATLTSASFAVGAFCSGFAGYIGVWISVRANLRVAGAANSGNSDRALKLAFRGGAFSAIVSACMCMLGLSVLYCIIYGVFVSAFDLNPTHVPLLLSGYGFGASFVALFMQLGGGIYTKAADVGADMCGKIDCGIPEDDPRNPAVIADLVGDNVGDCAGSMADIFESIAAEIIGTMILAATLSAEAGLSPNTSASYVFYPLVIHSLDVFVSSVGIMYVSRRSSDTSSLSCMRRGYAVTTVCAIVLFTICTRIILYTEEAPSAWWYFLWCGYLGIVTSFLLLLITQYYTDYNHGPVQSIARAALTGHGTCVIQGIAVGMESCALPTIVIAIVLYSSYSLGNASGLTPGSGTAGLFGTAVATMGMLCTAVFVLSMNNFGPIADNAGGIVEMSSASESARVITDELDAVGNVTKAATKGFAVGGSALACFLLFRAYLDEVSAISGTKFHTIDISRVEVLIGGMLGVMMVFLFTGWSLSAVGVTAQEVVREVRRQLKQRPGILEGIELPRYRECTEIVTRAALRQMIKPCCLALGLPVVVGLVFKNLAGPDDKLLGVEVLGAYMMFGSVTALLMAMFLDNSGGAWDNSKKWIEAGAFGEGKGSEAHKAAVTGDTVGDPCKDTAGPSLHVIITTMSTTILVLTPLFMN